jgi:hypothetical protein
LGRQGHLQCSPDLSRYLRKWIPLRIVIGVAGGFGGMLLQFAIPADLTTFRLEEIPFFFLIGLLAGSMGNRATKEFLTVNQETPAREVRDPDVRRGVLHPVVVGPLGVMGVLGNICSPLDITWPRMGAGR